MPAPAVTPDAAGPAVGPAGGQTSAAVKPDRARPGCQTRGDPGPAGAVG